MIPHQNWRGQFVLGTYASGARSDCTSGQTSGCEPIAWPGHRTTAWHRESKAPDIRTWYGGLVDGMRDASGQMYMRNRYYDPATGQFTQPDPIGLAGGLNAYGFAAGDPVSYSDPYGLCPKEVVSGDACKSVVGWLRGQKGEEFKKAADIYEGRGMPVFIVAGDHTQLGGPNGLNRDGDPDTWTGGTHMRDGSAVYLNGEFGKGDLLITAVHESKHVMGA